MIQKYNLKLFYIVIYYSIFCFISEINAQEITTYKKGITINNCFNFDFSIFRNFKESKNIDYNNSVIKLKSENAYIISQSIRINKDQNAAFLAFSYVINSNNINSENIDFYYSTSINGITFEPWNILKTEINTDSVLFSELAYINYSSNYLQFKIVFKNYHSDIELKSLKISIINPGQSSDEMNFLIDYSNKSLNTSTLPKIIKRTEWGCGDGENSPLWLPQYTKVTHLVIHHTAGSNNTNQDYPATVRSIWSQHTYTNGWGDIGYNYLIDSYGRAYEGRAGGNNAIGAHCGYNTGTMGVSVMGTYISVLPSDTSLGTLVNILAWKSDDSKLDPLGNGFHASSNKNLNTICGHRDVKSTDCPGDDFYNKLNDIREKVNQKIIINTNNKNEISCYPNPYREILNLNIKHINWKNFTIELIDIYGRIAYYKSIVNFENGIIQLNLGNISNGIYYLKIITPTDILFNQKIIKTK